MALPLMPKATAVWLVENTTLSFEQIAEFCGLHALEVQAIADGEVATGIHGLDPVGNGQLTRVEIARCQNDVNAKLKLNRSELPQPVTRTQGGRYTPISRRQDKPDGIAWILKHYPEMSDGAISKLIGTTKQTIASLREKTHWNMANIKARHPVTLGLCSQTSLDHAVTRLPQPTVETTEASGRANDP